jgi:hypothetical protein
MRPGFEGRDPRSLNSSGEAANSAPGGQPMEGGVRLHRATKVFFRIQNEFQSLPVTVQLRAHLVATRAKREHVAFSPTKPRLFAT